MNDLRIVAAFLLICAGIDPSTALAQPEIPPEIPVIGGMIQDSAETVASDVVKLARLREKQKLEVDRARYRLEQCGNCPDRVNLESDLNDLLRQEDVLNATTTEVIEKINPQLPFRTVDEFLGKVQAALADGFSGGGTFEKRPPGHRRAAIFIQCKDISSASSRYDRQVGRNGIDL